VITYFYDVIVHLLVIIQDASFFVRCTETLCGRVLAFVLPATAVRRPWAGRSQPASAACPVAMADPHLPRSKL